MFAKMFCVLMAVLMIAFVGCASVDPIPDNSDILIGILAMDCGYIVAKKAPEAVPDLLVACDLTVAALNSDNTDEEINELWRSIFMEELSKIKDLDPMLRMNLVELMSLITIKVDMPDAGMIDKQKAALMVTKFKAGMLFYEPMSEIRLELN